MIKILTIKEQPVVPLIDGIPNVSELNNKTIIESYFRKKDVKQRILNYLRGIPNSIEKDIARNTPSKYNPQTRKHDFIFTEPDGTPSKGNINIIYDELKIRSSEIGTLLEPLGQGTGNDTLALITEHFYYDEHKEPIIFIPYSRSQIFSRVKSQDDHYRAKYELVIFGVLSNNLVMISTEDKGKIFISPEEFIEGKITEYNGNFTISLSGSVTNIYPILVCSTVREGIISKDNVSFNFHTHIAICDDEIKYKNLNMAEESIEKSYQLEEKTSKNATSDSYYMPSIGKSSQNNYFNQDINCDAVLILNNDDIKNLKNITSHEDLEISYTEESEKSFLNLWKSSYRASRNRSSIRPTF